MIMFGASSFILVIGAEFFFGVEIPESLDIVFLPVFFSWLIGITAGTYTAFSNKK
jgi:ABC-type dipeptide/oligopeptide/nickel transport system permease component